MNPETKQQVAVLGTVVQPAASFVLGDRTEQFQGGTVRGQPKMRELLMPTKAGGPVSAATRFLSDSDLVAVMMPCKRNGREIVSMFRVM